MAGRRAKPPGVGLSKPDRPGQTHAQHRLAHQSVTRLLHGQSVLPRTVELALHGQQGNQHGRQPANDDQRQRQLDQQKPPHSRFQRSAHGWIPADARDAKSYTGPSMVLPTSNNTAANTNKSTGSNKRVPVSICCLSFCA